MKNNPVSEIKFLLSNYLIVPVLGLLICLLEACGRVRFYQFERFPLWEEKLIIVSNHPSLLEPVMLPLMGFPWMNFPWLFSRVWYRFRFSLSWISELQKELALRKKYVPANVPDRQNFYEGAFWKIFEGINVPVDRKGGAHGRIGTVLTLKKIIENGGRVLIFPEGTRTFKAVKKYRITSSSGRKLGKLKDGAAWLALKTNARILPIWVEGTDKVLPNNKFPLPRLWHQVVIRIGTPFEIQVGNMKEATSQISQALLELADEKVR